MLGQIAGQVDIQAFGSLKARGTCLSGSQKRQKAELTTDEQCCNAAGRQVEQVAALHGVRLRAGCSCNPGCCAGWLGLTAEAIVANYRAGHVCWDDIDMVDGAYACSVRPAGSVCSAPVRAY